MLAPFEATVENPRVRRGATAVFRCSVPESVRDHVTVTSWIQDNRYDIFLTSSQGIIFNFILSILVHNDAFDFNSQMGAT